MPRPPPRTGSILDALALILIVAIAGVVFLVFLLPTFGQVRESSLRISCKSNLRQIYNGLILYTGADRTSPLPRTLTARVDPIDSAAGDAILTWGTGAEARVAPGQTADPFSREFALDTIQPNSRDKLSANDVSAAFFWLLRSQDISASVFVCPSSFAQSERFGPGTHTREQLNFGRGGSHKDPQTNAAAHLSYSLHNPYVPSTHWRLATFAPKFPLAADVAPPMTAASVSLTPAYDPKSLGLGNSLNHGRDGQHVLAADGSVQWSTTPLAGPADDNLYTSARNTPTALGLMLPASPADTTLAITSYDFGGLGEAGDSNLWINLLLAVTAPIATIAIGLALRRFLRRRPRTAAAA